MSQKLYPSAHILEMFMPYLHDEKRLIEVLKEIVGKDGSSTFRPKSIARRSGVF